MPAVSYVDQRDVTERLERLGITSDQQVEPILDSIDPGLVRRLSDPLLAVLLGVVYLPPVTPPSGFVLVPSPDLAPDPLLRPLTGLAGSTPGGGGGGGDPTPTIPYPSDLLYPADILYPGG